MILRGALFILKRDALPYFLLAVYRYIVLEESFKLPEQKESTMTYVIYLICYTIMFIFFVIW